MVWPVIICFCPSSVTLTASSRMVKSPTVACWPGLSNTCSSCLNPSPAKPEEEEHDPDVDDVAAVAALVPPGQSDERGEDVGARDALTDTRPAPELLSNRAHHERTEGKAEARCPDPDAQREQPAAYDHARQATGIRN